METDGNKKKYKSYLCDLCDYDTSRKSSYISHLSTAKHKNMQKGNIIKTKTCKQIITDKEFYECNICNKELKSRSGLWKHKQKCSKKETKQEVIDYLLMENLKIKQQLVDQNKQIFEIINYLDIEIEN